MNNYSYTSADSVPIKLLKNRGFLSGIKRDFIQPVHIQFCPTNKCNLKCGFCSCSQVDKDKEMSFEKCVGLINSFVKLDCQSVTITGGGEPLMHKDINKIISEFKRRGIEIGLVTNGTLLARLNQESLGSITWCRISCSDERKLNAKIQETIQEASKIDWAFSYVVTSEYKVENLKEHIEFANKNDFSHVRVVSDLIDLDSVPSMQHIKDSTWRTDTSRVIYQERKGYSRGAKKCLISLLKPIISADGGIYPCCGVQYAKNNQSYDFPESMRMGDTSLINTIWQEQVGFDGSKCIRCYYDNYNQVLEGLLSDIKHLEFV